MEPCETLARFRNEIEQMAIEIERYRQKPGHSPYAVQKMEKRITRLIDIYNALEPLGKIDLWSHVADEMRQMRRNDPELNGLIILFGNTVSTANTGYLKTPYLP